MLTLILYCAEAIPEVRGFQCPLAVPTNQKGAATWRVNTDWYTNQTTCHSTVFSYIMLTHLETDVASIKLWFSISANPSMGSSRDHYSFANILRFPLIFREIYRLKLVTLRALYVSYYLQGHLYLLILMKLITNFFRGLIG